MKDIAAVASAGAAWVALGLGVFNYRKARARITVELSNEPYRFHNGDSFHDSFVVKIRNVSGAAVQVESIILDAGDNDALRLDGHPIGPDRSDRKKVERRGGETTTSYDMPPLKIEGHSSEKFYYDDLLIFREHVQHLKGVTVTLGNGNKYKAGRWYFWPWSSNRKALLKLRADAVTALKAGTFGTRTGVMRVSAKGASIASRTDTPE